MAKKGKFLEDALIFAVVVALVFAGLYLYNLLAPKPLYQEGIMGTMATQLDLIVKNLEIFQTSPSLENYLILKMAVSRAYGITLPAYAAYQKNNPRLSEKWQNLGILLNRVELELKNGLLKGGSADQALKDLADRLKDLNEPLVKLSEKFRDWSKDTTSEEKASLFWSQLAECEKAIAALTP
jgi:hypothetical protein